MPKPRLTIDELVQRGASPAQAAEAVRILHPADITDRRSPAAQERERRLLRLSNRLSAMRLARAEREAERRWQQREREWDAFNLALGEVRHG